MHCQLTPTLPASHFFLHTNTLPELTYKGEGKERYKGGTHLDLEAQLAAGNVTDPIIYS